MVETKRIRAVQKRTLETRAKLIKAAEDIIMIGGFEALRVEEVVRRAGTAKGTFFAHFKDKDALMDQVIGRRLSRLMDDLERMPAPDSVNQVIHALLPLCRFMTCERYVFDVILRYSGAAAIDEIGPIAETFGRQIEVFARWCEAASFRNDIAPELQAEGIQAFMLQALAAQFCALHNARTIEERLRPYLNAWLSTPNGGVL